MLNCRLIAAASSVACSGGRRRQLHRRPSRRLPELRSAERNDRASTRGDQQAHEPGAAAFDSNLWTPAAAADCTDLPCRLRIGQFTKSQVEWTPNSWAGKAGQRQATSDIAAVIQEIVDQGSEWAHTQGGAPTLIRSVTNPWKAGNSIDLAIEHLSGDGRRVAAAGSTNGNPPELEIEWSLDTPVMNSPPCTVLGCCPLPGRDFDRIALSHSHLSRPAPVALIGPWGLF